jgi:hypothetical protein
MIVDEHLIPQALVPQIRVKVSMRSWYAIDACLSISLVANLTRKAVRVKMESGKMFELKVPDRK